MIRHLSIPRTKSLKLPSSPPFPSFSSSPPPDHPKPPSIDSPPSDPPPTTSPSPPPPPSYTSLFAEIKQKLKSPPPPPRRIPTNPPPPFPGPAKSPAPASLEEIRKHLAEFRLKSGGERANSPLSFQDLFKNDAFAKPTSTAPNSAKEIPFDSIRESLKKFRETEARAQSSGFNIRAFQDGVRAPQPQPQLIGIDKLPESIFGKERREKKGEEEVKVARTEFVKMYGYEELGEKLGRLRPAKDGAKGERFSLSELNERLAKLRELEEREIESKMGGVSYRDLRESLQRLKDSNATKKANGLWFRV